MPQVGKLGNGMRVLKAVTMLEEGWCMNSSIVVDHVIYLHDIHNGL